MGYVIGLDVGTTSVRSAVYNADSGELTMVKQKSTEQFYPKIGWVEEDAEEIFLAASLCLEEAADKLEGEDILALAITNMRETVVCWDSLTGKPLYNAIIWQCRRTKEYCEALSEEAKRTITDKTGLVVDAYFSASKIRWLLDNSEKVKAARKKGRLMVGTVDAYLIYRLTGLKSFVTDVTNASRTMLYNIKTLSYDKELLDIFGIEESVLPRVIDNDEIAGYVDLGGKNVPIAGVVGDQQAALYGQGCFSAGSAKVTYGTGLFMLFNTGEKFAKSKSGLISAIAFRTGKKTVYALEGSVFNAGTAVQWLRDKLGVITTAAESEALAKSVPSSDGVCFVPAFTGLGAPHWKSDSMGLITGLTRGSTKAHIVRAALESMAFSARQLIELMENESGAKLKVIKADGGASANGFLMQYQADQLGKEVIVPASSEATVFGAIRLALNTLGIKKPCDNEAFVLYKPGKRDDEAYEKYLSAVKRCVYEA
ncbi:MAG TPA: glycerol kinase [Clostridiales bacterium]|nr:glycerol kinase [Clostridiales bacterium]